MCAAAGEQSLPAIVSDGSGGALLAWSDERSGSTNADIYSQRILGTGSVAPGWTADGVAVCAAAGNQGNPSLAEDGSHGALVTWSDLRGGATSDVYAHRILSSGAPDPQWPVDGRALCSASNNQALPVSAADGFGGAIVTWTDFRASLTNPDVYAQHVTISGVVDDQWPADGAAISVATGSQASPKIIADGSGGAVVLWTDARNGATNADLYAQRVQASGALGGDVVGVPVEHASTLHLGPVEPNPVRGSAPTLAYGLPESGPARLELFDLSGRRILNWELSDDPALGGRIQLDRLGRLRPGVYQLRLTQRAQTTTRRFVVL